ncbi:MAG: aldehyde dehydrogenase family protein [Chloroflexota bacterium]
MTQIKIDISEHPFLLAGQPQTGKPSALTCPYDGMPVGVVHQASADDVEAAIEAAVRAFDVTRRMSGHQRAVILHKIVNGIQREAEVFAQLVALEAGKPITQSRAEVERAIITFTVAAEEATRFRDEVLHLDGVPGGDGRQGFVRRFPVGPVAAITPFNFPLNLVAHKLAPAIAAGCPIVLKPAPQTPITSLKLGSIIVDAGWPPEALSVLPLAVEDAAPLVEDERFKLLTFTGSPAVGWAMKQRAGRKRVTLELGGNAGVIIHSDADLADAAKRCVTGGFAYAGQSCISVQRIFVQEQVYDTFIKLFAPQVEALNVAHPLDEAADLSSLIRESDGQRVREWLDEACAAGAEVLVGGRVEQSVVEPTIVVNASPELRVNCQEIFAPVVTIETYIDFDDALRLVNHSEYGLQAGIFTRDIQLIFHAYETLDVGGVMVNEVPTWRSDAMPYGGVKQSGFGREGLKYAIEEMTEPKVLVLNLL